MIDIQSFRGVPLCGTPRVQRLTPRQPQPGAPSRSTAPPPLPLPDASVPKLKSQRLIPIQNAESDLCKNGVTAFGRKPHSFISRLRPKNEPRSQRGVSVAAARKSAANYSPPIEPIGGERWGEGAFVVIEHPLILSPPQPSFPALSVYSSLPPAQSRVIQHNPANQGGKYFAPETAKTS